VIGVPGSWAKGTAKAGTLDSRLGLRWREFTSHNGIGKAGSFVRAVAKGLVRRMTAAAERYGSAPCKAERRPLRIDDFKIALDADGTVAVDGNFSCGHFFSSRTKYAFKRGPGTSGNEKEPAFGGLLPILADPSG